MPLNVIEVVKASAHKEIMNKIMSLESPPLTIIPTGVYFYQPKTIRPIEKTGHSHGLS